MSDDKKKSLISSLAISTVSLISSLAIGAVIAILVFILGLSRDQAITRCICDACFVAAVALLGIGGLKGIRNKGAFDIMGYGLKSTVETFIPMLRRGEKEDIYAYQERKEAERKPAHGLLAAGVIYLIISLAALVIYYIV